MGESDTIAAIATAMSNSGIGIIRISGDQAFDIAEKIFKRPSGSSVSRKEGSEERQREENGISQKMRASQKIKTDFRNIYYGHIYNGNEVLDEVLMVVMKSPHSYTAEDTVEINCHGGVLMMKRILETVVKYGARPAEPGEFTKRAFLNGRIDLSQAEAVMDVISAENQYALKSSVGQLGGSVSRKIKSLRERIIYQLAQIESALDDPEHSSLEEYPEELKKVLESMIKEIEALLKSADNGRVMKEGVRTVIVGKPNVGKSSLLNILVGQERAIVTDIAGTTRDTLEEHIQMQGISLNVVDTAGIRDTGDMVEQIGVSRAKSAAEEADLIIYVVDASVPLDDNDREIIQMIQGKKALVLLNKTDLETVVTAEDMERLTGYPVIEVSAKEETGISDLEKKVISMFYEGEIHFNDEIYITNLRHKTALTESLKSLMMVMESIDLGMPEDFFSIDLMDAYTQLGTIIGEEVGEDLINEIFSKFCTGK